MLAKGMLNADISFHLLIMRGFVQYQFNLSSALQHVFLELDNTTFIYIMHR
jgi:hypothetical protein